MYADRSDMVLRFSEYEIVNLENTLNGVESINSAIRDASDIADGYVGVKYPIPLPEVPKNLKIIICDIARYFLWKNEASEEVRKRYEDAIAFLKRVADGKAILTIKITDASGQDEVVKADTSPQTMPIGTTYRGGVFGDVVLDMMPSIK
ncbi:DUF1320 domain-containing protein [Acinetobacter sichuanensis]|uniref:gp436 family protein n=1 Tax=Acinetobacter sichuanensis TaxID=2136183 RepID=UPI00280FF846|nr:DUF1320 domain-containing protein [Acinetobacter sichuanensis]MDQ9021689.1 DUF1320 domain-containing protein [Acinetobacter sichuanensis]